MNRPLPKDPIKRMVNIRDVMKKLYSEGKINENVFKRALQRGRIDNQEFFNITDDINYLER